MKKMLQRWVDKNILKSEKMQLIGVNYECFYNSDELYKEFYNFVSSHIDHLEYNCNVELSFTLIHDEKIYSDIVENVNNKNKQVVLSYCSKEKGMIRANKTVTEDGIKIYKTEKSQTVFIIDDKKYYFIVNDEYMKNISFKRDGYKFFEHVINKIINVRGSVLVHSAAVASEMGAVLIVGPKRSGKTTTFLEFIRTLNMRPLSVDKTHLFLKDNSIDMYGFPTRLRVLSGTLKKYGDEFEHLIPEVYRNATQEKLWKGESDSKVDLPYDEFEKICNNKAFEKNNKLTMVILPNISEQSNNEIIKPTYEEFYDVLNSQIFSPFNPEEDWWSDIGKDAVDSMFKEKDKLIEFIWNNIPVIKVSAAEQLSEVLLQLRDKYSDIFDKLQD